MIQKLIFFFRNLIRRVSIRTGGTYIYKFGGLNIKVTVQSLKLTQCSVKLIEVINKVDSKIAKCTTGIKNMIKTGEVITLDCSNLENYTPTS